MALLRSARDGLTRIGRRRTLIAHGAAWLGPAALGALLQTLLWAFGTQTWGDGWLMAWATAALLLLSPAFTWFGLVLAAPLTALLMQRGWFGWLPALGLGTMIGATLGWLIDTPLALPFGTACALILRAALGWIAPEAT